MCQQQEYHHQNSDHVNQSSETNQGNQFNGGLIGVNVENVQVLTYGSNNGNFSTTSQHA